MRKLLIAGIISLVAASSSYGQQLPQYTQYILNDYIITPAKAGVNEYYDARTNYRSQWVGINDAPRTYVLSVNGPLEHEKMGIGGYLFVDKTGPTQRVGFDLSYSYHVAFNDEISLSMAINAGILQYSVDGTEIRLENENDNVLSNSQQSLVLPDAGFSFYLYHDDFFFGGSAPQLLQSKLNFDETISNPTGKLVNHYYFLGGYRYDIDEKFQLEPSFLLRYVRPMPLHYELSIRGIYEDMAWLGFTYRQNTALALMVGYSFQENFSFGYSYDFIQTSMQKYSSGTHEIMLSFKIFKATADNPIEE